jgi:hypothetical protein
LRNEHECRGEQGIPRRVRGLSGAKIRRCRTALQDRVLFEAPRELIRLLRDQAEGIEFIAKGDDLPHFDFHCPLMSLPLAFGTTLATIPAAIPYLRADRDKIAAWRARLGEKTKKSKPRIGLVWSS